MIFSVVKENGAICLITIAPDGREIKKQPVVINGNVVGWIKSVWIDGKMISAERIGRVPKKVWDRWNIDYLNSCFVPKK